MNSIKLIIDLSTGSTGKGLLAAFLADKNKPDTLVTAFAPNAGHTSYLADGTKLIHKMLANGINSPSLKRVMIGPGAVINEAVLIKEIENAKSLGLLDFDMVYVHENAAVVLPKHIEQESEFGRIGSTQTGSGAAAIQKIMRNPDDLNTAKHAIVDKRIQVVDDRKYLSVLSEASEVQLEGAQGYGLSIHHGPHPYCTSRDVTPMQILADCGIPWKHAAITKVIGVTRTYPIRVANKTGSSGPCYEDQKEISFADIGQEIELTTVTKLPRRVFTYSKAQMEHACSVCSPDEIFLNFANYCQSSEELIGIIDHLDEISNVAYVGFGATNSDVLDVSGGFLGARRHAVINSWNAGHVIQHNTDVIAHTKGTNGYTTLAEHLERIEGAK